MYPVFDEELGCWDAEDLYDEDEGCLMSYYTRLPQGTIEKLIGRKLTWKDKPYKYE